MTNYSDIVRSLLRWYQSNARDLPWRRTTDPYAIWVSEIMLQQTQVATVVSYWERWMKELPGIDALARCRSARLHKLWEGLGYYTRVRNLQNAARVIVKQHGGTFPTRYEDVLELPGIGPYTAGAICSIAYNQPTAILDGNVIRVLSRVLGVTGDPREKKTNAALWHVADLLVHEAAQIRSSRVPHCSFLNQSLMELGALVCTPRQPACAECPLSRDCFAFKHQKTDELPALAPRQKPTRKRVAAFILQRGDKFLVRQREKGVVNGHLWEFPNVELNGYSPAEAAVRLLGIVDLEPQPISTITHSITRYRISLEVYRTLEPKGGADFAWRGEWLTKKQMQKLAFPSAHGKILNLIGP